MGTGMPPPEVWIIHGVMDCASQFRKHSPVMTERLRESLP